MRCVMGLRQRLSNIAADSSCLTPPRASRIAPTLMQSHPHAQQSRGAIRPSDVVGTCRDARAHPVSVQWLRPARLLGEPDRRR